VATGWGRAGWGEDFWGATSVSVAVTGLTGTTTLGNEANVTGDANLFPTNVVGTSAVNSVVAAGFAITGVSGTASTVGLGDETVTCDANVFPTNVVGTTGLGTLGLVTVNILSITGLAGTSALGTETVQADANMSVDNENVLATGQITDLLVWGLVDDSQTPNYSTVTTTQSPNWSDVA